jgi:seryl-tRNA synthetase
VLDIKLIRNEPAKVAAALSKRQHHADFTEILGLDDRRRALMVEAETLRARRKELARASGQARAAQADASLIDKEAGEANEQITRLEQQCEDVDQRLKNLLAELPNIPDERVPAGGKENNQVVRVWGEKPHGIANPVDHVTLCRRLGLIDYERGTKIGGSGFWLYTGMGAAMEWALLDYFCREHFRDGYEFLLPPHLLTYECGFAAGQFPKFEDAVFHLRTMGNDRARFLLPTAETAVLNVYRDEILEHDRLPIKCFAYSPCYRREGGAHRTEERGTIRGHQFNKVEMFQFVSPEQSEAAIEELVRRAERMMEGLGLHYRTTLLAAQDASSSMALTYDIEVWIPSINTYKEVSSVSWARDFQARRANIRFRRPGKKHTEYVHTLNGSGLATSRLFPAIVEQFQQQDGSVVVPAPLRPWIGRDIIHAPTR